jgi:MFS family permease
MMSLINTNYAYLKSMQISKESPVVGIIVSVYYLGCTFGAVIASWLAGKRGRKTSIFACLATTSLGNIFMFISGLSMNGSSLWGGAELGCMLAG